LTSLTAQPGEYDLSLRSVGSGIHDAAANLLPVGAFDVWQMMVAGDFNGDHRLDCADINLLVAAVAAGSGNLGLDLNGDSGLSLADVTVWLSLAGAAHLPSGSPYLPGDANLDGVVDGSDFNIWNAYKFLLDAAWCHGDFNADGAVDGSDFTIWNAHKFRSSTDLQAAAPTKRSPRTAAGQVGLPAPTLGRTSSVTASTVDTIMSCLSLKHDGSASAMDLPHRLPWNRFLRYRSNADRRQPEIPLTELSQERIELVDALFTWR
jgi:hypothetical protein